MLRLTPAIAHQTEADKWTFNVIIAAPGTGPQLFRIGSPRTAAHHPSVADIIDARPAVGRGTFIVFAPAIFCPFPKIAAHVVKAKSVGRFLRDRLGRPFCVIDIPGDGSHVGTAAIKIGTAAGTTGIVGFSFKLESAAIGQL